MCNYDPLSQIVLGLNINETPIYINDIETALRIQMVIYEFVGTININYDYLRTVIVVL